MTTPTLTITLAWNRFRHTLAQVDNRILRWAQGTVMCLYIFLSASHNSIQAFLEHNLQQLLGADMRISLHQPLSPGDLVALQGFATALTRVRQQQVTLTNGSHWQQVQLKAVGAGYPLQGQLVTSESLTAPGTDTDRGPAQGDIWVDTRLFTSLRLTMGQSIPLGDRHLRVAAILHHEPDRLLEKHSMSMRAMIHQRDFDRARLLTETTRYSYLIDVDPARQPHLEGWIAAHLSAAKVNAKTGGAHPLSSFWQRVENFLGLSSLTLVLLAAIACLFAGRRQLVSQKRFAALTLAMGMSRSAVVSISFMQWLFNACLALIPALAVGQLLHLLLVDALARHFPGIAPAFSPATLTGTCAFLLLLFLQFQLPCYWQLLKVSPGQLIKDIPVTKHNTLPAIFAGLACAWVAVYYSDNWRLSTMILISMGCATVLLIGFTLAALVTGERLTQGLPGRLPFVCFIMRQRLLSKTVQVLGLGLSTSLLLFSLMLSGDIASKLTHFSQRHLGNLLITQATSEQVESIKRWSARHAVTIKELKPYKLGQLISINNRSLATASAQPSEALSRLQRPVRLSWSPFPPDNNRILEGNWWPAQQPGRARISVEQEVMEDLGLALNDQLSFRVAGRDYRFTIAAVHAPVAGKSPITFWFQIPPAEADRMVADTLSMGSAELPDRAWGEIAALWNAHPTLRMVSVAELTKGYKQLLEMFKGLLLMFSGVVMTLTLVVIVASASGYEAEDRIRTGLLLCMGQNRYDCTKITLYEWIITALIASLGAAFGAWITGTLIYREQFSLNYQPDPQWLLTILAGALLVTCAIGMTATRRTLDFPVRKLIAA